MENEKLQSSGMSFKDLGKKLDNFWYHYKIQTIIALVLVVTLVICTFQLITREKHDYCILYAGPAVLAVQDLTYMRDAFEDVGADYDGNGEVVVTFDDIVIMSPEEQAAANEEGAFYNPQFAQQSMTEYYQQIFGGDSVICLLSPYMYEIVHEADGFLPLAEVLDTAPDAAYDECAVVLAKTDFGQYFNGINDLPEDTLICVRRLSSMAKFKGEAKTRKAHEANLELFRAILAFEAPESGDTTAITVTNIIDRTKTEFIGTADALEGFYTDEEYRYSFPSIKSRYIDVYYSDGTSEKIKDALAAGRVTIADLDTFDIDYYKDPIVTAISYTATFIRADSMSDGGYDAFVSHAENADRLGSYNIPIAHISDVHELAALCDDIRPHYQTSVEYNSEASFDAKIKEYDAAFFVDKSLLILAMSEGSGSIRHNVESVDGRKCPDVIVCIRQVVNEIGTCDMADWFAIIEVSKADIESATAFWAWYDK